MKLSTAKVQIKRWGLLRFVYDGVMSRLRPWFSLYVVNLRPLDHSPDVPPLADGREVRVATREELLLACSDPVLDLKPDFVECALARGETCVAVFQKANGRENIVAYVWLALSPTRHERDLWVKFDKRYPYRFKAFTHPAFRQQRLQHAVGYKLDPLLLERGYTHCIALVESHNFPSLISDKKRGHQCVGFAGYLTLFGRIIPFRSRGTRKYGSGFCLPHQVETEEKADSHAGRPFR